MTYTKEECIRDTQEHIDRVRKLMVMFAGELIQRAIEHDKTKLESPEVEIFTEYTPKLRDSTYGSEEYHTYLKEMNVAIQHHYAHNSHHPEHYENGIRGMDLVDIVEMICDWKAATMRHADGDIEKSITINKQRFGYSEDLEQIFRNTVKILK